MVRRYCLGPKINWSGVVWESTWRAQRRPKPKRVRTEAKKIRRKGNDTWKPRGSFVVRRPRSSIAATAGIDKSRIKFTLRNQMHSAYKQELAVRVKQNFRTGLPDDEIEQAAIRKPYLI